MTLKVDHVAVVAVVSAEEMIEADFVERGGRRERRDVTADALVRLVRSDDHRGGIPADEALDAALDVRTAGHQHLVVGGNRVDVRGIGGERQLDAVLGGVKRQVAQQARDFDGAAGLQHIIERLEPFAGFDGIELRRIFRGNVSHGPRFLSPPAISAELSADRLAGCRPTINCNPSAERRESMRRQLCCVHFLSACRGRCEMRTLQSDSRKARPSGLILRRAYLSGLSRETASSAILHASARSRFPGRENRDRHRRPGWTGPPRLRLLLPRRCTHRSPIRARYRSTSRCSPGSLAPRTLPQPQRRRPSMRVEAVLAKGALDNVSRRIRRRFTIARRRTSSRP